MVPDSSDIWLRIPPDTFYLGLVRKVIVDLASRIGFQKDEVDKIEIAVDEACSSVIQQSKEDERVLKKEDRAKNIELSVDISQDKIVIRVIGTGSPLNMAGMKGPSPDEFLTGMNLSDLGIYIIKNFMDEVDYETGPKGRNELTLVKYLKK